MIALTLARRHRRHAPMRVRRLDVASGKRLHGLFHAIAAILTALLGLESLAA
jgi:hypothetical protein